MILSQEIARLLEEMLRDGDGELSIGRNDLAERFGCVPSQINYVISSRFTPERGYVVESRRGGGGFIRIRKVQMGRNETLMHFYHAIGDELNQETARVFVKKLSEEEIVSPEVASLLFAPLTDRALSRLPRPLREEVRADLLKNEILQIMSVLKE